MLVSLKVRKAEIWDWCKRCCCGVWLTDSNTLPWSGWWISCSTAGRETSIQAPKAFSRSLKTLLFPADLALLLKDITLLVNLVLPVCHHKWWLCVGGALGLRTLHRHHRQLLELQCCHQIHSPHWTAEAVVSDVGCEKIYSSTALCPPFSHQDVHQLFSRYPSEYTNVLHK